MSTDENKALLRRFYAEIDAGNIDAMDELVAEDYLDHNPPFPGLPPGREGLKLTATGRHERDLPGPVPATGAELRETAVAIHRIADGMIVEHWSDRDDLALMQQLGVITLPSG